MSEDEKKVDDNQTVDEDKTKENESDEQTDDKDLKSAIAQKEHFRVKAEKLEQEKQELLAEVEKAKQKEAPNSQAETDSTEDISSIKDKIARIEFSQKHPEIAPGDIEQIFQLANMNSKKPDEILEENDMVKTYLKEKQKESKIANATPDNRRGYSVEPEKPISEMTREEHKAWAEKVMGQAK